MRIVSVPYGITLLSNNVSCRKNKVKVSVPYGITLLSNIMAYINGKQIVSVPYGITLLSNGDTWDKIAYQFQYLMELHYSQTSNKLRHYNAQGNNIRYIYYTI